MQDESTARSEDASDAALLHDARSGGEVATEVLHERHGDAALAVARQYTGSDDEAEALVVAALDQVDRAVHAGAGPEVAYRLYLFAAVRRLALTPHGSAHLRSAPLAPPPPEQVPGAEGAEGTTAAGFVDPAEGPAAAAFASLPERWQAVLWYAEVERLPAEQTARLLGLSTGEAATLAYLAREGFRGALLSHHLEDAPTPQCRLVHEMLPAYLRGDLSRRDTARVRGHLDTCEHCQAARRGLEDTQRDLRGIVAPLVLGAVGLGALGTSLPVGALAAGAAGAGAVAAHGRHAAEAGAADATGPGAGAGPPGSAAGGRVAAGMAGAGLAGAGLVAAGAVPAAAAEPVAATPAAASGPVADGAAPVAGEAASAAGTPAAVAGEPFWDVVAGPSEAPEAGAGAAAGAGAGAGAAAASTGVPVGVVAAAITAGVAAVSLVVAGVLDRDADDGGAPVAAPESQGPLDDSRPDGTAEPSDPASPAPEPAPEPVPSPEPTVAPTPAPAPSAETVPAVAPAPQDEEVSVRSALLGPRPTPVRPPPAAGPAVVPVVSSEPVVPALPGQPVGEPPPAPAEPSPASLDVSAPGDGVVLVPGAVQTLSVGVVNIGDAAATDVRASFTLPAGVALGPAGPAGEGWAPCGDAADQVCLAELPAGASSTMAVPVRVEDATAVAEGSVVGVTISATGLDPIELAVPVSVASVAPEITLGMPGDVQLAVDQPQQVTFTVRNASAVPARDVVASVSLPPGVRWTGSGDETSPWACEPAGDAVTCTVAELAGAVGDDPAVLSLTLTLVGETSAVGVGGQIGLDVAVDGGPPSASSSTAVDVRASVPDPGVPGVPPVPGGPGVPPPGEPGVPEVPEEPPVPVPTPEVPGVPPVPVPTPEVPEPPVPVPVPEVPEPPVPVPAPEVPEPPVPVPAPVVPDEPPAPPPPDILVEPAVPTPDPDLPELPAADGDPLAPRGA